MAAGDRSGPQYSQRPHVVYIAWRGDEPLYVGCTCDFDTRMQGHLRDGAVWPSLTSHVDLVEFPDKRAALDVERDTIRALLPTHNVKGKTPQRQPWQPTAVAS